MLPLPLRPLGVLVIHELDVHKRWEDKSDKGDEGATKQVQNLAKVGDGQTNQDLYHHQGSPQHTTPPPKPCVCVCAVDVDKMIKESIPYDLSPIIIPSSLLSY